MLYIYQQSHQVLDGHIEYCGFLDVSSVAGISDNNYFLTMLVAFSRCRLLLQKCLIPDWLLQSGIYALNGTVTFSETLILITV